MLHQRAGAVVLLLGERQLSFREINVGARLVEAVTSLLDLSLRPLELRGKILCVHPGQHLPGFDHVAFVHEHLGDAAGELGVDIDLVRLDPAVAGGDASRQAALLQAPPIAAGRGGGENCETEQCESAPSAPSRRRRGRRRRDRQGNPRRHERSLARGKRLDLLSAGRN